MKGLLLKISEKMIEILPDWLFGKSTVIKEKCKNNYGLRDWKVLNYNIQIRNAKMYLILTIIFIVSIIIILISSNTDQTTINSINRPEYGERALIEKIRVRLSYQEEVLVKDIKVRIPPKDLTKEEAKKIVYEYRKELPLIILKENDRLNNITSDLFLPERVPDSNISIKWSSDTPEILNNKGQLDPISANKGDEVVLTAVISLEEFVEEVKIPIKIQPSKATNYSRGLENRLNRFSKDLEQRLQDEDSVSLPNKLMDGKISAEWVKEEKSKLSVLISIFGFIYLIIFFRRYDRLEKEFKSRKEAIIEDFPDFIDKLILLLNAGLVTDVAIRKIANDYQRFASKNCKRPLYDGIVEMQNRIEQTNSSFIRELKEFAQKSCVRELIRFASIVEDNISKGSTLTEKLQGEGSLLWLGKKKKAEEKGRLAETKMTFPLLLLLLALIIISTGPVLLQL